MTHRGLQKPSLEQDVPRMLVGINGTMYLVVKGHMEDDGKIAAVLSSFISLL